MSARGHDVRGAVWRGIGWGALIGVLVCAAGAGIEARYGRTAGVVTAIMILVATIAAGARWLYVERRRPVVVTPLTDFAERPGWGFEPTAPPAHRFDPKVVIAAVAASRMGRVWQAPISTHEIHAAAWGCERQGQLPPQIAETFRLDPADVEWLLSYEDPDDALAQRAAAWGQA